MNGFLAAGGSLMERAFVVLRSRGPAWDDSKGLEEQADWTAHAAFMEQISPWQIRLGTVARVPPQM